MEETLEFYFVYSKDAVKIKTFLGSIPRSIECINYMDVYNKLSKNDYLQLEPSDAVVSSYLMKHLQLILSRSTTQNVYYVLGTLDEITINGIKSYIKTLTTKKINYKIFYTPDTNLDGVVELFSEAVDFDITI
jgi:hypothetical protein